MRDDIDFLQRRIAERAPNINRRAELMPEIRHSRLIDRVSDRVRRHRAQRAIIRSVGRSNRSAPIPIGDKEINARRIANINERLDEALISATQRLKPERIRLRPAMCQPVLKPRFTLIERKRPAEPRHKDDRLSM